MESKKLIVFTAGHGHLPLEYFLRKLLQNGINLVVDCRTYPVSRFAPHFSKNALRRALEEKSIGYIFRGANLGGRAPNHDQDKTIDELSYLAQSGLRICLLCSETKNYRECHRYTILTPLFENRGFLVQHIIYDDKPKKSKQKQNKLF